MSSAMVFADRIQFAFTIMFHYLFPIITMGLGVVIAWHATWHFLTGAPHHALAARFWTRIFAVSFVVGVVTGIPMEFQFGTNWSQFSSFAGAVFGLSLPLEGTVAFFLESSFLGLFLFGQDRVPEWVHWLSGLAVAAGALVSGFFITVANAWMQNPVGYGYDAQGHLVLTSFWQVFLNPYLGWQYAHVISGSLLAAAFLVAGVGALYLLLDRHRAFAQDAVRLGVLAGLALALLQLYPTGDGVGHNVTRLQPVKLAAMEGQFATEPDAPLAILGMPDAQRGVLLDPVVVPAALSFLAYGSFGATVLGLNQVPRLLWPPVEVTYYAYHIMVGLGTLFILVMALGAWLWWRQRLFRSRWFLWTLLLAVPFPLIANEAGWTAAEVGRQPWVVYGLLRTSQAISPNVSTGETAFTLAGFAGLYLLLALLFLLLVGKIIAHGPDPARPEASSRGGRAALPAGKTGAKDCEPGPPGPAAGPGGGVIPQGQTRPWRVCAPGKRMRRGPCEAQRRLGAAGPPSRREHKRDARRTGPGGPAPTI